MALQGLTRLQQQKQKQQQQQEQKHPAASAATATDSKTYKQPVWQAASLRLTAGTEPNNLHTRTEPNSPAKQHRFVNVCWRLGTGVGCYHLYLCVPATATATATATLPSKAL